MKALALLMIVLATSAQAFETNQFETHDQARQRQSAENYDAYKKQGNRWEIPPTYQGPLGGTDRGVERPGYNERYDPYTRTYR